MASGITAASRNVATQTHRTPAPDAAGDQALKTILMTNPTLQFDGVFASTSTEKLIFASLSI